MALYHPVYIKSQYDKVFFSCSFRYSNRVKTETARMDELELDDLEVNPYHFIFQSKHVFSATAFLCY